MMINLPVQVLKKKAHRLPARRCHSSHVVDVVGIDPKVPVLGKRLRVVKTVEVAVRRFRLKVDVLRPVVFELVVCEFVHFLRPESITGLRATRAGRITMTAGTMGGICMANDGLVREGLGCNRRGFHALKAPETPLYAAIWNRAAFAGGEIGRSRQAPS
jgi:hypothetical protein